MEPDKKIHVIAASATALFTGILTFFTIQMYRVAENANESTQRSQRAVVSIGGITNPLRKILSDDGKRWDSVRVGLFVANGGVTPPRNLRVKINHQLFANEIPIGFQFDDLDDTPPRTIFLGPSTREAVYSILPMDTLITAVNRKQRLFFWGWATYSDVFSDTPVRLTEFCLEAVNITFSDTTKPSDPTTNMRFDIESCDRHNCYDGDCPDYERRAMASTLQEQP
jgi:hypothetical protein